MRATQVGFPISIHMNPVIARFMRATQFLFPETKMGGPHKAGHDDFFKGNEKTSPGWPAFAGHDDFI
jgi:hypothetical protein